eukprot:TRINITY_DN1596_c0_g1_i1.p2 TRINITY_DN1596_c0_g1~~TRINITY_DN1596_c0_g1_i1.p2  ORF type:complete len:262 (+),score=30.64 TRINITY_DN1596_c0_g1_i1:3260-4045(+)
MGINTKIQIDCLQYFRADISKLSPFYNLQATQMKENKPSNPSTTSLISTQASLPTTEQGSPCCEDSPYEFELQIIRKLPPAKPEDILARQVFLGKKTKKYTLLFDLDETLVCSRSPFCKGPGLTILVRPLVAKLLKALSPLYELVVFTAASEDYAQKAIRCLDPEKQYFKKVLTNQHCLPTAGGQYIKDLRIIADRRLDEMLIIDNSVISFAYQLDNGVPIDPYIGDKEDKELGFLTTYLLQLYRVDNIVEANKNNIGIEA